MLVIQANGTAEFENGLKRGRPECNRNVNNLQRVLTIPDINTTIDSRGGVDLAPHRAEKKFNFTNSAVPWY